METSHPPFNAGERESVFFSMRKCQNAGKPNIHALVNTNTTIANTPAFRANPVTTEIVGAIPTRINPSKARFF